jgi:4-diphosphocytidyl-2-C-methyl-D-erythritol kinase
MAVGSDVPFFLWPGPQLAMGRGQVLKDVVLPGLHAVVVMPDLGLSTAAVYKWRDEDEDTTLKDFAPRVRALSARVQAARSPADVAALVHNDLEASVTGRKPAVAEARDRLLELGARAAAMTGSGAAVFGLFASEEEAGNARAALAPARAWTVSDLQPLGPRRGAAAGPPRQG